MEEWSITWIGKDYKEESTGLISERDIENPVLYSKREDYYKEKYIP